LHDYNVKLFADDDMTHVNKNLSKKQRNIWYEARLLSGTGDSAEKAKKVYVYISPKVEATAPLPKHTVILRFQLSPARLKILSYFFQFAAINTKRVLFESHREKIIHMESVSGNEGKKLGRGGGMHKETCLQSRNCSGIMDSYAKIKLVHLESISRRGS
jgi:hypothetical protein